MEGIVSAIVAISQSAECGEALQMASVAVAQ